MRLAVLLLAILGASAAAFLGARWYHDTHTEQAKAVLSLGSDAGSNLPEAWAELRKVSLASYALLAAALLGVAGGFLAALGKGVIAGPAILLGPLAAGALQPKSLVFTSPLLLAGVLSFLIRPSARRQGRREEDEEAEDEEGPAEQEEPAGVRQFACAVCGSSL